jgi:hypothetical protein
MEPITYPVLLDMSRLINIDEEAMIYMAGEEGSRLINCAAFLIKDEINGMTIDTFSQFNPLVPIKSFQYSQRKEAIAWLKYMTDSVSLD